MKVFAEYLAYIKDNPNKYWFRAKWYGWGWVPTTWQGWVTTAAFILLVLVIAAKMEAAEINNQSLVPFFLVLGAISLLFVLIAYKKGENPRWSWGNPKKKDKK